MKHAATAKITLPAMTINGIEHVAQTCTVMGHLTTEHAGSSYGQPVFVGLDVEAPAFADVAFGPADVDHVSLGVDIDHLDDATGERLIRAARHCGFRIA